MEIDVKDSVNKSLRKGYIFQFLVAFSATLPMTSGGASSGWDSPNLPKLMANDSYIPITSDQSSWIISTFITGIIIGTFPAAWLMDKFGRKYAMLAINVPNIFGWTLIGVADSILYVYIGKFSLGIAFGWSMAVTPIYLGEIASDKIRGSISAVYVFMYMFGILYAYILGTYFSISMTAWLCMIPTLCFITTFVWFPESPYYILSSKSPEEAYKSLSRLRCSNNVQVELDKMKASVELSQDNKGKFRELFSKNNRYRLLIILALVMSIHLTGFQAILFYTETIFRKMNSSLDPSYASIIFAGLQLISAAFCSLAMDMWGRRPLLLLSLTAIGICNIIIGLYFLFETMNYDVSELTWLPVVTLMIYIICFTLGVGSVPFVILGEIFPKNIKNIVALVFVVTGALTGILTVKCFQIVTDYLGVEYAFFGFATFCFVLLIIFGYFLPETKGKPIDVILEDFSTQK